MSRIGKLPIQIPAGVTVDLKGQEVTVKGPKGELKRVVDADMILKLEENVLTVARPTEQKRHKSIHGLTRALLNNMVVGVAEGYKTVQELVGVGYRATAQGQLLELHIGYSHPIYFELPKEVKVTAETVKGKNPIVTLESADKQLIGAIAAKIRAFRAPEPYKGKGIKFAGEQLRRKAGKTAGK